MLCMRYLIITLFGTGLVLQPVAVPLSAANPYYSGYIFLAAEANGELWYVKPETQKRTYLATDYHVLSFMQKGVGIRDQDLEKIPIGLMPEVTIDTDQDGLSDAVEYALNLTEWKEDTDGDGISDGVEINNHSNPKGTGMLPLDMNLAKKLAGMIVLQVEDRGQAWYIHPVTHKRYSLGTPAQAFETFVHLALGINNQNLAKIPIE